MIFDRSLEIVSGVNKFFPSVKLNSTLVSLMRHGTGGHEGYDQGLSDGSDWFGGRNSHAWWVESWFLSVQNYDSRVCSELNGLTSVGGRMTSWPPQDVAPTYQRRQRLEAWGQTEGDGTGYKHTSIALTAYEHLTCVTLTDLSPISETHLALPVWHLLFLTIYVDYIWQSPKALAM